MRLKVTNNVADFERQLDGFRDAVLQVAVPRAVNALRSQAQTAGLRRANELYQIGPRTMEQYLTNKVASAGDPEAGITAKGKTFGPSVYRPTKTDNGTVVTIKGKRVLLPHAFVLAAFGGRVFARGAFSGQGIKPTGQANYGFQFGRGRFPIASPFTLRPADVLADPSVTAAMDDRVAEQAATVLAREIKAAARGF